MIGDRSTDRSTDEMTEDESTAMTEQGADLWDDPARDYRQRYRLPDQFTWDVASWPRIDFDGYTEIAFEMLPAPPARVLDVGCGPGMGSRRLLEHGYEVVGVDYNERAVAFARILAEGGRYVQADIRDLDGTLEGPFDAAVCIEVLEHVPPEHRQRLFEGVLATLKPGGRFVVTTPSSRMRDNAWDYERVDLGELEGLLEAAGFAVQEVRFQHRLVIWFSPGTWRLFSNRWYDLRGVRHLLRRRFLSRWNRVSSESGAGRYVVVAERP